MEGERGGGRDRGRDGGREGGRKGEREGGRERGREWWRSVLDHADCFSFLPWLFVLSCVSFSYNYLLFPLPLLSFSS